MNSSSWAQRSPVAGDGAGPNGIPKIRSSAMRALSMRTPPELRVHALLPTAAIFAPVLR